MPAERYFSFFIMFYSHISDKYIRIIPINYFKINISVLMKPEIFKLAFYVSYVLGQGCLYVQIVKHSDL